MTLIAPGLSNVDLCIAMAQEGTFSEIGLRVPAVALALPGLLAQSRRIAFFMKPRSTHVCTVS